MADFTVVMEMKELSLYGHDMESMEFINHKGPDL